MARPTLFRLLLLERGWQTWARFCVHFEQQARSLANEWDDPRLAGVTVGRRTFDRWISGDWYGQPRADAARVLEALLGFPTPALFSPAPDVMSVRPTGRDGSGLGASLAISQRWPSSRVFVAAADDVGDTWELLGGNVLDGTIMAVQFHPASRDGDDVTLRPSNPGALERFLRPARRGLIVGVHEGEDGPDLYILDSSNARTFRFPFTEIGGPIHVPAGHLLDDFTYGILWALVQLDDGLLADDQVLDEERQVLATYLSLPRSAPSRMSLPSLTSVGAGWLGSAFCAQHIQRHLQDVPEAPLFWTREQTGEEAAAWLFFRHKLAYLRQQAAQFGGAARPLARAFCIPEAAVARCAPHERILVFLAVALMELLGIHVQVTSRPEYAGVDGFALVPGRQAVVANWVRTEALWQAAATSGRAELRGYHEAFDDARHHSVVAGPDPQTRLHALADYLSLDWPWLISRSRELGECGVSGLIRPRNRLLGINAIDDVLRFLGTLAPGR